MESRNVSLKNSENVQLSYLCRDEGVVIDEESAVIVDNIVVKSNESNDEVKRFNVLSSNSNSLKIDK